MEKQEHQEKKEKQEYQEYQELGYLRNEINQRVLLYDEQANKTITTVLLIWGGACVILGKDGINFTKQSPENMYLCFIVATIFCISNLVLYLTARRHYYLIADGTYKLASYLAVFYETRPSEKFKVGENFSWELATFEMSAKNSKKENRDKGNLEYFALTLFSTLLIILLSVAFYLNIYKECGMMQDAGMILLLLCLIYLAFSIYWLCNIPKYTFLSDGSVMRAKHLNTFIQYAIDTGHDTKESLKERLGKIWDLVRD